MVNIGKRPEGRLPRSGDKVHISGREPGFVYVVRPPGTVERGCNVWSVRVRPHNGVREFWALLSNVTIVKSADANEPSTESDDTAPASTVHSKESP